MATRERTLPLGPLAAERVRELLDYDPATGVFLWRVKRGGASRPGDIAGSNDGTRGYLRIEIDRTSYYAQRLAWLWFYGEWPADKIDHRNENKLDNRIANLREATNRQNRQNMTRKYQSNTSGFTGVTYHQGGWQAVIGAGGKRHYLGSFATAEEASAAYFQAKAKLHEFWVGRKNHPSLRG